MRTSLSRDELLRYVETQCTNLFPDRDKTTTDILEKCIDPALERMDHCVSNINRKYFYDGREHLFDHLNSDQYAMFLYFLSNSIYIVSGGISAAKKIYYLNKILHSIDVFYEVNLPEIFLFRHCVGTVLGRAIYKDYFTVGQNCTIGNNRGQYPVFSEYCALYSGATVVGSCHVGRNVHISSRAFIRNQTIPDDRLAITRGSELILQPASISVKDAFFDSFGRSHQQSPNLGAARTD